MSQSLHLLILLTTIFVNGQICAQDTPIEQDFSKIVNVRCPEDYLLEVGGLAVLPNGDLGIATRRGDVFIIENPTSKNPYFRRFATGLHEVLGLVYKDGAFYCAQRGELTRLEDTNLDGIADVIETVYAWPLSGHYHEYNYGPAVSPDGSFFVSTNLSFDFPNWWRGKSKVPWRGWILRINADGRMEPWATGMRSPAGIGMIDGQLFYSENQGDWIGSGAIWHIEKGDFTGNPAGLEWTDQPNSPLSMTKEQLYKYVDRRINKDENGKYIKPENIPNEEDYKTMFELADVLPDLKTPAVWLPYGILGTSTSDILSIPQGYFGPFEGQILVGDQGQSKIIRIFLEKVKGTYQGAAFEFRSGFQSGVMRMAWANDGSLFVGETNRGWGSAGTAAQGLQRLIWNNQNPFEMKTVRATPDGFEITFTEPVEREKAEDLASYSVSSFIYKYQPVYGSPMVELEPAEVKGVKVYEDEMKVRIIVNNLRKNYIHHITLDGIRSRSLESPLLHSSAYYTLNEIPDGKRLSLNEVSTKNSSEEDNSMVSIDNLSENQTKLKNIDSTSSYEDMESLLSQYTCSSCHKRDTRKLGPPFIEIAKRNYSNTEIVELMYSPDPKNWPNYENPMPSMTFVPRKKALLIADWINSLDD